MDDEEDYVKDPMVIDPPNFDQAAAWNECREYVDACGGLSHDDGEPNWRAAFGADPGLCSCPCCDQMFWAWGRRQRCTECGFEYDTDWWAMYSWGGQEARRGPDHPVYRGKTHEKYMRSKWYRWAFENAAEPTMEAAKVVAWKTIFPEDATNCK